ncbi:LmbE family N-acetylglucosaminyl deacetylase [Desulfobaculum xiamenense]|uniref:LmbE family N-acetylglucosaminyl deacetylase n=1 Tax=Desulfobaculum xiamenense TaxID=995050 RepID=A0A846QUK3_9BACT|nr:PIG-L family deacetylase [Desulfobaculum xiamenense]NJB69205.1 LmbE family N-acetylglucosaminyl deacetylase [Desulfobaculum xiamenense]
MTRSVLAIGAHFDDIELGCAGTLIRHVQAGHRVTMLVLTHSGYTLSNNDWERPAKLAFAEGRSGAAIIGADLACLGLENRRLAFQPDLISLIDEEVVRVGADTIYTHWDRDVHQDHAAAGAASLTAGRRVDNVFMYRSNWYQSTEVFRENYCVDISRHMERKIEAIRAHASEVERRGEEWIAFFRGENARTGARCGVAFAEGFQLVKGVWSYADGGIP